MPEIIILCGIPASGKSTWTKKYITNNNRFTKSISRDDIRERYFSQPYIYTKQNEDRVTEYFNNKFNYLTQRKFNIIMDNTHCKEKYIDEIINKVDQSKYRVLIKFFDIPLWKAYFRSTVRKIKTGKDIPLKILKDMNKNYKKINREKYKNITL